MRQNEGQLATYQFGSISVNCYAAQWLALAVLLATCLAVATAQFNTKPPVHRLTHVKKNITFGFLAVAAFQSSGVFFCISANI